MSSSMVRSASKHALPAARNAEEGPWFARQAPCRRLDSGTLLAGGVELVIEHGDEVYRLRLTRQNRLSLTK